jgi:hypothetical protein
MHVKNADQTACEQLTPAAALADQSSLIVQESASQLADVMIRSFVWRECGLCATRGGVSNGNTGVTCDHGRSQVKARL